MIVKHYLEVKEEIPQLPGAQATLRWLISKNDGAKNFALRLFEIKHKGEKIPLHNHHFEHEAFVIEGNGKVKNNDTEYDVEVGDAIFVLPDEPHSFINKGDTPFRFICVVPII